MGKVPASPRWALGGAVGPVTMSSIPPVPKVILARPGRGAALAERARPAGRRRWPRSAERRAARSRSPTAPEESTILGSIESGIPRMLERPAGPTLGRRRPRARDPGVGDVGDVQPRRRRAARPPRCRWCRSGARSTWRALGVDAVEEPLELGGRRVGGQPEPLGLEHQAVDHGAQVLPADARADGLAGPGVPDDRRRPLVGDAHAVDLGPRRRAPAPRSSRTAAPDQARRRTRRCREPGSRAGSGDLVRPRPPRRRRASTTPRAPRRCRRRRPGSCPRFTRRSLASSPSLPGFRMPRGSSAALIAAQHADGPRRAPRP